ncbi:hypothetical protein ONZ45_g13778 [Pleurotus djamor]|nr:hypothetical protein ONZ45_g13778 [Pleurotus djamor]
MLPWRNPLRVPSKYRIDQLEDRSYFETFSKRELHEFIIPQRLECWSKSKKLNSRTMKQTLLTELLNPANGFEVNRIAPPNLASDEPWVPDNYLPLSPTICHSVLILLHDARFNPAQMSTQPLNLDVRSTLSCPENKYYVATS